MAGIKNVYEAFHAVMAEVKAIEKSDRNMQQGFNFRGIDAVMQEVGPVLRANGVFIIPTPLDMKSETYATAKGTAMRNVTVTMQYTVYGPGGDYFVGGAYGEAADSGDKAVTKAQSVAYRTFLLTALTVPTGDADPDAHSHERAARPAKTVAPHLRKLADLADKHKLDRGALAARFMNDYGVAVTDADPKTVEAFTGVVADEIAVDDAAGKD